MLALVIGAFAQEPAASEPTASEPAASEPAASEPTASEPEVFEPAASEPEVFEIPAFEHALPSATRRLSELGADDAEVAAALEALGLDPDAFDRPALVRGAWFVRPRLAWHQLVRDGDDGSAMRLGLSAGRRWWTMEALPVQVAADLGVRATAPVGQGVGRRLEAVGHVGPWLGPVRVELGAVLRWERERWFGKTVELADAWMLGPEIGLGVDARWLRLGISVAPTWRVAGDRAPARDGSPVLPTLGDETTWSAAVGVPLSPIGFTVDASWRDTVIGGGLEVGLSLHVSVKRKRKPEAE